MSGSADRRARGRRNHLADRLALGAPAPLVDLPVSVLVGAVGADDPIVPQTTVPVMIPYGAAATILVEDSEPEVLYSLRVAGADAPSTSAMAEAKGDGGAVLLVAPVVEATTTFAVDARTPRGRTATLRATGAVEIGLDRGIPVALDGDAPEPALLDYGATVAVRIARSQEAVSYSLVLQPPGADRDAVAGASLSPGIAGTGGALVLASGALTADGLLRVRAERAQGRGRARTVLLDRGIPVHVRADPGRPVTIGPAVSDHAGTPVVTIGGAQKGVRYALAVAPLPDTAFRHDENPEAVAVDADGESVRVAIPRAADNGDAAVDRISAVDADGDLAIALPPLTGDAAITVRAIKTHGVGDAAYTTEVTLTTAVVALVRPDPAPPLRIEATIDGAMLRRLALRGGEPGVFYAVTAGRERLGELYMHQRDPDDPARNKGIGALGIGIDLTIAADLAAAAPPPVARLDCARRLPVKLLLEARRATTGLTSPLAATVTIEAIPKMAIAPAKNPAAGFTITLDAIAPGTAVAIAVDGAPRGDPVTATADPPTLVTGLVADDAEVTLLLRQGGDDGIVVTRRITLALPRR